jgi:DNA polymerase elongation subunit (family B)
MYKTIHVDKYNKTYFIKDDELGWIIDDYKPYCYRKDPNGTLKTIYGDMVKKVPLVESNQNNTSLFEIDVPSELRVLTDLYLDSDEPSKNNRIVFFDIETIIIGKLDNASVKEALATITSIALYDATDKKRYVFILDKEGKIVNKNIDGIELFAYRTESSMLRAFLELWIKLDIDFIIHYNGCFFDVPFLYNRLCRVLGKSHAKKLSPLGIVLENDRSKDSPVKIAGIESLDYMLLIKKYMPGEFVGGRSLNNVCIRELGHGKLLFKGNLNQLFHDDIDFYIKYNMNDVDLLVELDEKLSFIDLTMMIAHSAHTNCENIYYSSIIMEGVIYTHLKRKGIVSPNKPVTNNPELKKDGDLEDINEDEDEDVDLIIKIDGKKKKKSFAGGFVLDPVRPLCSWLCDEDFKSLYNRICITMNIGQETYIGRIREDGKPSIEDMNSLNLSIKKIQDNEKKYQLEVLSGEVFDVDKNEIIKYIKDNNFIISPNGMIFRTDTQSVISEVMTLWGNMRDEYKNLMKEYRKKSDFVTAKYYENRSNVRKTLSNSIYGCLSLIFFRYTTEEKYLSTATTMTGQFMTRRTIDYVNEKYNKLLNTQDYKYIVYSDTDSLFVECFPIVKHILGYDVDVNEDEIIIPIVEKISEDIMNDCNSYYNTLTKEELNVNKHYLELKPEFIIKKAYFSKKKKYALYLIRREGTPIQEGHEFEFKGLDIIKANFNESFKKLSKGLIIDILNGAVKQDIDEKIINFKDWSLTCPMVDLSLPIGIKQLLEKYTDNPPKKGQIFSKTSKGALSNFKASIRYNDLLKFYGLNKNFTEISIGDSVKYFYLKDNPLKIDSLAFKNDDNPSEILDIIEKYADRDKNFDTQLLKKLQTLYDSLNWGTVNLNSKKNKFFSKMF